MKTTKLLSLLSAALLVYFMLGFLLSGNNRDVDWIFLTKTPLFEEGCKPQGMTFSNEVLLLAVSCNENISHIYEIDKNIGNYRFLFSMPSEASHTSGLTYIGGYLWACDYNSNKIYKVDLNKSIDSKKAFIERSYDSSLNGLSSCTYFRYGSEDYLVISDFMRTRKNYLVNIGRLDKEGITSSIRYSYKNRGFSQGLTSDGNLIFESNAEIGKDIIYSVDISALSKGKPIEIVDIFATPFYTVEDIAIKDGIIYTSDEFSFEIYKTENTIYD